ncbi:conserved hypothetical protein [Culex quinquefasciatus]|uniref:Uncharacterized protein n=1 Tax=Culex quinquefasciatus TaxID=7176 RepID=B0WQQ2_CULQU|nr:conserved hypothetical protein [Culex quinquefasciatus]|eukprot:XP_001851036.1 conserved hypothetical protein [Culex quinquefasciatus]
MSDHGQMLSSWDGKNDLVRDLPEQPYGHDAMLQLFISGGSRRRLRCRLLQEMDGVKADIIQDGGT